jgi:hypothetical protein
MPFWPLSAPSPVSSTASSSRHTIRSYQYAVIGGIAGLILIPAIALLRRFVIQCVLVGMLGLAVYYAFFK